MSVTDRIEWMLFRSLDATGYVVMGALRVIDRLV